MRTLALLLITAGLGSVAFAQDELDELPPAPEPQPGSDAEPEAGSVEPDSAAAPADSCLPAPVELRRVGVKDPVVVRLTDCEGQPARDALEQLSALAQPDAGAT